jgi:hypothetical protein
MNITDCECEDIEKKQMCIDYIISLASVSTLFIISEILPFLKEHKGNGLVDLLICLFSGSECCLSKVIDCLKGEDDDKDKGQKQKQEQQQSIKTDEEQHLTNSVNINIQK